MEKWGYAAPGNASGLYHLAHRMLWVLAVSGLFSGCIARVQIPSVDQFHVTAGAQEGIVDAELNEEQLLKQLYALMKANEGAEVPICTADRASRRCLKEGVRVFVLGGVIPGVGIRSGYAFNEISLDGRQLAFKKDNSRTTFIGTPMLTRPNDCRVHAAGGGLQVEMTRYYANWAGIGNMFMAEGWNIDFLDLNHGIVGLQLELDIKGYLTTGGGSRYVLLKFPNTPASPSTAAAQLQFLKRN
jgi:hypothetical protein